jgi:hypothetical protein
MITYLLVSEKASLEVTDASGRKPLDYARENHNSITEQVATHASKELLIEAEVFSSPDIQMFLKTFGYVERLDFLNDLRSISQRMSDSITYFVTDELSTESATDYTTDEEHRSRPPSRQRFGPPVHGSVFEEDE